MPTIDQWIHDEILRRMEKIVADSRPMTADERRSVDSFFWSYFQPPSMLSIPIKRTDPKAILPSRAKPDDAAYDLYSLDYGLLEPGKRVLVRTGIAISIPRSFYGRIAPRSGLAVKHGIDVLAGVIDSGFIGEIKVALINHGSVGYLIEEGARIAQLIIEKCHDVEWQEVAELDDTARSSGGFGSSGS